MIQEINILTHVIAGTAALLVGIIPFLTKKGGLRHRKFGKVFLGLMCIVIVTAFIGVIYFRDRPFLTMITIQSTYLTVSGYRALRYKESGPNQWDFIIALLVLMAAISFVARLNYANIVWNKGVVYYLLVFIVLYGTYDLLRVVRWIRGAKLWLLEHLIKMTGAFTALFSAAAGTVLGSWEFAQIGAAILGSVLFFGVILMYVLRWRKGVNISIS